MPTYTIKSLLTDRNRGWEGKGGPMIDYWMVAENGQGKSAECYLTQKATTAPPEVGQTLDATVEKDRFENLKLKKAQMPLPAGGGGGARKGSPEERASIESQVAAKIVCELAVHDKALEAEREALRKWVLGHLG